VIIRSVEVILGTARDASGQGWKSRRLVLEEDGIDYSVHETTLEAGQRLRFEYGSHRETVCRVSGSGICRGPARVKGEAPDSSAMRWAGSLLSRSRYPFE
jgi:hypothetical protein